jgi:hypothetical protein
MKNVVLIDSIARAERGSVELDRAILEALFPASGDRSAPLLWATSNYEAELWRDHGIHSFVPRFTSSVDHALYLVKDEWDLMLGKLRERGEVGRFALLYEAGRQDQPQIGRGEHPTSMAIALTAAAVKAWSR